MGKNRHQVEASKILCTVRDMARERIILTQEDREALQERLERLCESLYALGMTASRVAEDACDAFLVSDYDQCEEALIELIGLLRIN